jgi:hypothetical protein
MAAQEDDLLGAKASGGNHAAQADGAVGDGGYALPRANSGHDRRVMACPHHVCKRQKRGHQRVVHTGR